MAVKLAFEFSFPLSYRNQEGRTLRVSQGSLENGRVIRILGCVPSGRVYSVVHPQAFLNI